MKIELFDTSVNSNRLNKNLETAGTNKSIDQQKVLQLAENGNIDEVFGLLNKAGLTARMVNLDNAAKITFNMDNREYSVVYNPASENVNAPASVQKAPEDKAYAPETVVNMDDDKFTKEEIFKLGFISQKDLNKYFDYKNGIYTLKSGLVVEGKTIHNTKELMDFLGIISLDDYIEQSYGESVDVNFKDQFGEEPNDNAYLTEESFIKFMKGYCTLEDMLKYSTNAVVITGVEEFKDPSKYLLYLWNMGYITEEGFPTDGDPKEAYKKAVEYIKEAFNCYFADVAKEAGKPLNELTYADIVRDFYTNNKAQGRDEHLNREYKNYTINTVYTYDVTGDDTGTDYSVRDYFGEMVLDDDPFSRPGEVIYDYIASMTDNKNFDFGPLKALFKAAGVTENDSIEEKQSKVQKLMGIIGGDMDYAVSWEDLYLWMYDNGYIEQATYSAEEIERYTYYRQSDISLYDHKVDELFGLQKDENGNYTIDGKIMFYQDGVDENGNAIYKKTHEFDSYLGRWGHFETSASAAYAGYTSVTNAQEFMNAIKQGKPIVLFADIDMSSISGYLYIGTEAQGYPGVIVTNGYTIKNLNGEIHIGEGVYGKYWTDREPQYTQSEKIDKSNPSFMPVGTQTGTIGTAILYNYLHIDGYDATAPLDYVYDKNNNKVSITDSNWFEILTHPEDYTLPGEYSIPELTGAEKAELIKQAFEKLWNNSFDMYDSGFTSNVPSYLSWITAIITAMGGTVVNSEVVTYINPSGAAPIHGQSLISFELDGHIYTIPLQNDYGNKDNTKTISAADVQAFLDKNTDAIVDDNIRWMKPSIKNLMFQLFTRIDGQDMEYSIHPMLIEYLESLNLDYLNSDGTVNLSKVEKYVIEFMRDFVKTYADNIIAQHREHFNKISSTQEEADCRFEEWLAEMMEQAGQTDNPQVPMSQASAPEIQDQTDGDLNTKMPEIPQNAKDIINEFILESLTQVDNFSIDEDMLDNLLYDADTMIGDVIRSLNPNVDNIADLTEEYIQFIENRIKVINRLFIQFKEAIKQDPDKDIYEILDDIDTKTVNILQNEFGLSNYEYNSLKQSLGQYILSKMGNTSDFSSIDIVEFIRDYFVNI